MVALNDMNASIASTASENGPCVDTSPATIATSVKDALAAASHRRADAAR